MIHQRLTAKMYHEKTHDSKQSIIIKAMFCYYRGYVQKLAGYVQQLTGYVEKSL